MSATKIKPPLMCPGKAYIRGGLLIVISRSLLLLDVGLGAVLAGVVVQRDLVDLAQVQAVPLMRGAVDLVNHLQVPVIVVRAGREGDVERVAVVEGPTWNRSSGQPRPR